MCKFFFSGFAGVKIRRILVMKVKRKNFTLSVPQSLCLNENEEIVSGSIEAYYFGFR